MCHKTTYTYTLCSHPDTSSRNHSLLPLRHRHSPTHAGATIKEETYPKPLVHIHHCDTAMQSSSPAKRCEDLECETLALGLEGWCPGCRLSNVGAGYEFSKAGGGRKGGMEVIEEARTVEKEEAERDGWVLVDRWDGMSWNEEEVAEEGKGGDGGLGGDSSSEGSLPSAPPSSPVEERAGSEAEVEKGRIGAWAARVGQNREWVAEWGASWRRESVKCAGDICLKTAGVRCGM